MNQITPPPGKRGRAARARPVDVHVGRRLRLRRTLLGLSQERLAGEIGLTFQQIQKYERGANRIGASRLYELSRVLEVPVSFFFDDMPEEVAGAAAAPRAADGRAPEPVDVELLSRRETLELVRNYYAVPPRVRDALYKTVRACARGAGDLA